MSNENDKKIIKFLKYQERIGDSLIFAAHSVRVMSSPMVKDKLIAESMEHAVYSGETCHPFRVKPATCL